MAKVLADEGMTLTHIIGPKTGHSYHKESKVEINKRIDAIVEKGRERTPKQVKFTTFTLRYNKSSWVEIDRVEKHWERARVEAEIKDAGTVSVKTSGVRALTLTMAAGDCPLVVGKPVKVMLDSTTLGTFTPVSGSAFNVITTTPVTVTAGSHTLYFVGTSPTGALIFHSSI